MQTIGYEGSPAYLGKWQKLLLNECRDRGWNLYVNQGKHSDFDICVAFRDVQFNGYAQRHWKSNVKLSNCHGSGTPFIGQSESGYLETSTGMEQWVDDPRELRDALDRLTSQHYREEVSRAFIEQPITVQQSAAELQRFIESIVC